MNKFLATEEKEVGVVIYKVTYDSETSYIHRKTLVNRLKSSKDFDQLEQELDQLYTGCVDSARIDILNIIYF
jgi:hypothetical protein